jgi:uncharacterized repeat protein (TIGR01451 family)
MLNKKRLVSYRASRARRNVSPLECERVERRLLLSTFVVKNTNDDTNANSLRWAILQVNGDTTPDTIDFDITGSGTQTIQLNSPLPALTNSAVIDGTSQPGYQSSPVVVLDGSKLAAGSNGLTLSAGGSSIRGLAIVGFTGSGIVLNSAGGNVVASNYLGIEPSGTTAEGNGTGLSIVGSSSNTVGGTAAGAGNVISGNSGAGISIEFSTTDAASNLVVGNEIGTSANGLLVLGNKLGGVVISGASNNQIGGPGSAANVISANHGPGIQLVSGATGTTILNNQIGVGADGVTSLGNVGDGIQIADSFNTTIGGVSVGQGNVVGCNQGNGISVTGTSTGTTVEGNSIGTDPTGQESLGNAFNGVSVATSSNVIGGRSPGAGNLIDNNGTESPGAGVLLVGNVVHNTILSNSIYGNSYLGINLGGGPTDNHNPGTPGPNDFQNYPVLSLSQSDGTSTTIQGTLTSTPNSQFLVQFFGSPKADSTGYGQGKFLLGSTQVQTNNNGIATFDTGLTSGSAAGQCVSATATSPSGDTSEFGLDIFTQGQVNLVLTGTGTPNPVLAGAQETYTFTVANQGDINADGVTVTDQLPTGVTISSATSSQGSIFPSTNGTTIQALLGTIRPGNHATVTIVVGVPASMTGTIQDTASVTSIETDPNPSNETTTILTKVEQAADLSILMTAAPAPVLQGGNLTYSITVEDLGPAAASNAVVTLPVAAGANFVSATSAVGTTTFAGGDVTASLGNLALSTPVTITVVLQAETPGKLTETATVSSDNIDPNPGNNQVTVTSDVDPAADLGVTISASAPAAAATVDLTYTVTATNNGPANDTSVTLTDTLPTNANLVSATAQGGLTPTVQNGVVTLSIGNLASGSSETLTIVVDPTSAAGTTITDIAAVAGQLPDPSSANDTASLTLPIRAISDLGIIAIASPANVPAGETATFKLTVTNTGPANEPDAVVTSQLPANVNFVSAKATQGQAPTVDKNGVLTADLGALAVNSSAIITLILQAEVASIGGLSETFTVQGQNVDPNTADNSATPSVTVVPAADLSVTISPSAAPAYDQANWAYTLDVSNAGPNSATGVIAIAQLPPNVQVVSTSSSQGTAPVVANGMVTAALGSLAASGSATVTVVIQPTAVGSMALGASVSGDQADADQANNQESISVPVSPSVNLAVQLVSNASTILTGHNWTLTATVQNTGPSAATQVAMNLPMTGGLAFVSASPSQGTSGMVAGQFVAQLGGLAPGAQATINLIVTPTIAGSITATARATATQYQLNPQQSSATATVSAIESPGVLQFSAAGYAVSATAGSATLTVVRTDGTLGAVSVNYQTTAVDATPDIDYVSTSGQLSFASGQTTTTITVPVLNDPWTDHDEYLNVSLGSPQGGVLLGATSTASLRIIEANPDLTPFTVSQLSWSGSYQSISSLKLLFNAPVVPSLAGNSANYRLLDLSAAGHAIALHTPAYTQSTATSTFAVSLYPFVPLVSGHTYEIVVMGTGATAIRDDAGNALAASTTSQPGSNYVATFEQGTSLNYVDGARNKVTLAIKGPGYLEQVRDAYGNGQVLTVMGEVPGRTTLSGSIKKSKGATGRTSLGVINGLGNFGNVKVLMTSPPFMLRQFPFQKNGHGVL